MQKVPKTEAGGGLFHQWVAGAVIGLRSLVSGVLAFGMSADNFSGNRGQQSLPHDSTSLLIYNIEAGWAALNIQ